MPPRTELPLFLPPTAVLQTHRAVHPLLRRQPPDSVAYTTAVTYTTAGQRRLHHCRPAVTYPRYRLWPAYNQMKAGEVDWANESSPKSPLLPLRPPPSPSSRRKTQNCRTPRATMKPRRPWQETELSLSHRYGLDGGAEKKTEPLKEEGGIYIRAVGYELLGGDGGDEAPEHDVGALDEAEENSAGDGGLDGRFTSKQRRKAGFIPQPLNLNHSRRISIGRL